MSILLVWQTLWQSRHQGHDLLGTVINVHNGEWTQKDSGVGAGSDSYYEYVLKSYILFGDPVYLKRFQMVRRKGERLGGHLWVGGCMHHAYW